MPSTDVLLPKYVSDSCYAALTQIYIDMFKVSHTSNLWITNSMKKAIPNKKKVLSLDRPKKQQESIETVIRRCDRHLSRPTEAFEKNHKYRATWYLGQTKQIRDGTKVVSVTKL